MSYTVIARRWRPKKFRDVVGQPHIVTTIQNAIKLGRIPHSYLFTGPRGVGKTSLARIFSKAVNCQAGPSEEPCDVCENCLAINNGSFVDVIEIDAASTRKIDDIRELRETVRYLPMKGRYKVYILDESHMLTGEAKDAFLKTLEEPPGHNIFILATTEPQKIPYTIMSRCQRFDFRRIPDAEIAVQLKKICDNEGIGYDERVFQYITSEADGSLRDAESILEQVISYSGSHITEKDVLNIIGLVEKDLIYRIVKTIIESDIKEGLALIDRTIREGHDVHQVYKGIVQTLRGMMFFKIYEGVPPFLYMTEEEEKNYARLLQDVEYYEMQNMLHYVLNAENLLGGLFPKVSLEVLYVNLYNLTRLRGVEEIIDILEERDTGKEHNFPFPPEGGKVTESPHEEYSAEEPLRKETPRDARGFIAYLKEKKPFIGEALENLEVNMEGDRFFITIDKSYAYIRENREYQEEIKRHLSDFFGRKLDLNLKNVEERKRDILKEFVQEAELLFKI